MVKLSSSVLRNDDVRAPDKRPNTHNEEAEKIAKTSKGVVKVKTYFEIDNQYKKN